ncbi:hypothetical protein [Bradyrhizobium sp. Ce-3]|uniref:hypothetical protein n=1 Tax=Bradyrhizobium sp. Ce-3 TaxID=2913970 RepID=UPI001FB981BD|nr:hypothetical protein [Bradyrhizobium sp. Ce-3]GKQ51219.1 hypothetical protein BRSPCE3_20740 [Bradyrhizobium sp. Ce-3]
MAGWLRGIALLVYLGLALAGPASADGPGKQFKRVTDAPTFTSPDGEIRLKQYARDMGDDGLLFQFWTFDRAGKHGALLNQGETTDAAGYQAGFRFSPDSRWLVRMQKIGSGTHTLHLYKRAGDRFVPATEKPLGEAAWDFFYTQPPAAGVRRDPDDPYTLDHMQVGLIKGLEDNYAWLDQHWPDSRYLVIGLSFDIQGEETPFPWVEDWRCVYDLKTGTFSVPASFAEHNQKAQKTPDPARK